MNSPRLGLLVICTFVFVADANAVTYFVRKSGSDAKDGQSVGNAFLTIKRAAEVAKHNDTVYVGAGTYYDEVIISGLGTGTYRVRYVADVTGSRTGYAGPVVIAGKVNVLNSDNVELNGFTFQGNSTRQLVWSGSYEGLISGCQFGGGGEGLLFKGASVEVANCQITDFAHDGIQVDGPAKMFIHDTTISDCGESGLEIRKAAKIVLDTCTFDGNAGDGVEVNITADTIDDGVVGKSVSSQYLAFGASKFEMSGGFIKGYNSNIGPSSIGNTGVASSNVQITLGSAYLYGDAYIGGSIDRPSQVTGTITKYSDPITLPPVDDRYYETFNDNAKIPLTDDKKNPLNANLDFTLSGGDGIDLPPGTYYLNKVSLSGGSVIRLSGPVVIYSQECDFSGGSVANPAQKPTDCQLYARKDNISFSGSSVFYGSAYAPLGNVNFSGSSTFYGMLAANEIKSSSSGGIYIDAALLPLATRIFGSSGDSGPANPSDPVTITEGILDISSSTFTGNATGVRLATGQAFNTRYCDYSNNTGWGLQVFGSARVENCNINNNSIGGLYLKNVSGSDLTAKSLKILNNGQYGVSLDGSGLTLNTTNIADWDIAGSAYTIYGKSCELAIESVPINSGTTAAVSVVDSDMKAAYATFSDSGIGLSATNCNFALYNCTLSRNTIGLHADQNKSMTIQGTKMTDNTEWGVKLNGRGSFTDTTIRGNGTGGMELTNTNAAELSLTRATIADNKKYGLYCIGSTLTFNTTMLGGTTITGSETLFAGFESSLTFDGLTISGGSQYGIANYGGKVAVDNCTVSGNGIGLYSDYGCWGTGSTFTGNTTIGASVLGSATFTNCVFEMNANGLQITNDTTGSVQLVGSQIKDNTVYGVWYDGCILTFDATLQDDWDVQHNGSNFGATGSTLTFNGFTISNGTTYGIVTENGTLNLAASLLTANGTGAFVDANSKLVATNTDFTNNTMYGASIQGQASLQNCSFDHNTNGVQFVNVTNGEVTCSGTTVSDNAQTGLHLESCTLTLTGGGINGLTLSDNQYGIYGTTSTLVFDGFNSNNNTYGAWLSSSDVTMTNSTFTGSSYGLWATNNNSLSVDSSTFTGNSAYGVYLVGTGSLHDCSITGNGNGLYAHTTDLTDAHLTGTDISGNTGYGIYVYQASLDLTSQSTDGWSIDSNGCNVAGDQADISLIGATLTNAAAYGVYAQNGSLNVQASTITSRSSGVWADSTSALTVDRSHISGAGAGSWGVYNQDGGLTMRNTVVSGAQQGVYSAGLSKPVTIYNSTIADALLYGLYVDNGDLTVMNTIISGAGGTYGLYRGPTANVMHAYNLVSGFAAAFENTTADATEVLAPPRFMDAANGDFRLGKGSPAINSGADLTADGVTIDMLGNTRPSHKVFEIGAYEYMQNGGSLRVLNWTEGR